MLLWWWSRRRQSPGEDELDADLGDQVQEKAAWDAVLAANAGNDPHRLRNALLTLAAAWFPQHRNAGLSALGNMDSEVSRLLGLLDQQLYSQNPPSDRFDGNALVESLRKLRAARSQRKRAGSKLPPLYPQAS